MSYRPARLHRMAESIPDLLKSLKISSQHPDKGDSRALDCSSGYYVTCTEPSVRKIFFWREPSSPTLKMPDSNDQKCDGVMDDQKSSRLSILKSRLKIYDKTFALGAKKHMQKKKKISRKKEDKKAS